MPRTATVRSASLSPAEAALADELAKVIGDGGFTEVVRILLRYFGQPLKVRLEELQQAGIDPDERLFARRTSPPDGEEQIRDFYRPSTWPERGQ